MMAKIAVLLMVAFMACTGMAQIRNPPVIDASWKSNSLPRSGALSMTGTLDMGGNSITNISTNSLVFMNGTKISSGSNGVLRVGSGTNLNTVVTEGNIQTYAPTPPTYYADGVTMNKAGTTFSVASWIPKNLVDVYIQNLVHYGATSRGLLDGPGYLFNDENGILVGEGQSTNYVWGNVGYRNSISSTNIGGGGVTPVSQWKMNDNTESADVLDAIGSNTGTSYRTTSTITTNGKINTSLKFVHAESDLVTLASSMVLTNDCTLTFWVMFHWDWSTGSWWSKHGIMGAEGGNQGIQQYESTMFQLFDYDGANATMTTQPLTTYTWYHYAIVIPAGGGEVRFYLDGSFVTNAFCNGIRSLGEFSTRAYGNYFEGALDDIRYYTNALSQSDIDGIYNAGDGTEDASGGTVLYTTNSMSLVCTNKLVDFVPTATWMSILASGSGITTNDVQGYVSPDYGTTWYQATLAASDSIDLSNTLFQGTAIYTNNTTGSNLVLKAVTSSNSVVKILGMWGPSN